MRRCFVCNSTTGDEPRPLDLSFCWSLLQALPSHGSRRWSTLSSSTSAGSRFVGHQRRAFRRTTAAPHHLVSLGFRMLLVEKYGQLRQWWYTLRRFKSTASDLAASTSTWLGRKLSLVHGQFIAEPRHAERHQTTGSGNNWMDSAKIWNRWRRCT